MADISDVTAALKAAITALAYPTGTSVPSALGVEIQVAEGWPLATTLDMIAGKPSVSVPSPITLVSIYPVPGTSGDGGTYMDMSPAVLSHAAAGLSVSVQDATVTLSGTALGVENVVVIGNRSAPYAVSAQAGDTAATVATALFTQIEAAFPGSTLDVGAPDAPEIDVAGAYALAARVGTTGVLGRNVHRQRQQVRIVAWSSNPQDRNTVCAPIDTMLKAQLRFPLPDTSAADVTYQGTNWTDDNERVGLYRRDLIYTVAFDTIELIPATEVTAVGLQTTVPAGATISTAS